MEADYLFQGVPVACWHMDEDSWDGVDPTDKVFDSSHNKSHGTGQNGVSTVPDSERGRVGNFNGNNHYIDCGSGEEFDIVDEITLSAWIYQRGLTGGYNKIISKRQGSNFWFIATKSGGLYACVGDGTYTCTGTYPITENEWHHVALTFKNSEGVQRVYCDGNEVLIQPTSGKLIPISANLVIGADIEGTTGYFRGHIDDVKIYDRALSKEEILEYYEESRNPTFIEGLVGWWRMDETSWSGPPNKDVKDVSDRNNHGTAVGANAAAGGKLGRCGYFDGTNDYINCGNNDTLRVTGKEISVEAWVKWEEEDSRDAIVMKTTSNAWDDGYGLFARDNNTINFYVTSYMENCAYKPFIADNQWHHVVGTYDGLDVRIWVDGVEGTSDGYIGNISDADNNLEIGRGYRNSYNFKGCIDEVRIYNNRVLSEEEVKAHYKEGGETLVGYWHMDEPSWNGTSNEVEDSSDNSNHGTAEPAGSTPTTVWDGDRESMVGIFDGDNDYVNCGNDQNFDVDKITVEAWAYFSSISGHRVIASMDDITNRRWAFYLRNEGPTLRFFIIVSNSAKKKDYPWVPELNRWYHLVGTADGNNVRIYIDGVEVGGPVPYSGKIDKDPVNLRIGRGAYPGYFQGRIDEVRIYGRALSEEEIVEHRDKGNKDLVGCWRMDEDSWSGPGEVIDASGTNNHGTADGAVIFDDGIGRCGSFNSSNHNYIDCGNDSSLDLTNEITLEAWIKPNLFTSAGYIWVRNIDSYANIQYSGYLETDNSLRIKTMGMGTAWNTGYSFPVDKWKHVVVTVKSGDLIKYYIDGEYQNQHSCPAITSKDCKFNIGARNDEEAGHLFYFNGLIDEVGVFGRVLSAEEILEHYEETKTRIVEGLTGYWRMDEKLWNGTVDEVVDSSYNKNHGTACPVGNTPTTVLDEGRGVVGSFNSSNHNYIDCGNDSSLDLTNEITLEAWIKPKDFTSAGYIWVRNEEDYQHIQYSGYLESDNRFHIKIMETHWTTDYFFPVNKWKHVVVTAESGGLIKYYIDGEYQNQYSCPAIISKDYKFNIGARNDVTAGHLFYFDGLIDEVRIFGRVLSAEEILEHYESGIQAGGIFPGSYVWKEVK